MGAEDSSCSDCEPHAACPPGQGVIHPGDHLSDTRCGKCLPGTFSNRTSTTERCVPHTNCSALRRLQRMAGNGTSDSVCGEKDGDVARRESSQQPGGVRPRTDGTESTPDWVLIMLLLVALLAVTACLLQGTRKLRRSLHVSCFKSVFKSCVVDPEAHHADQHSPDATRSEDFLFPPAPAVGTEAPAPQEACLAGPPSASSPQEELLRGRAQEPVARPGATHGAVEGIESGGEQAAGFVGPVFIYNPACVYMGLIQSRELTDAAAEEEEEDEDEAEAAVEERGEAEARSLPYPQQEAGGRGTLRQSGPRPEQETGKGEHLSEEASEVP
ncbi:tumor necrosis factor receptor superfamily member 3-like [Hypanus sabinus]|uniref:tumor necrosis factor receptor superfamily member 3-like n=1 Tax=Hypanus sabinus TaxID=79690 RepID=UPI0028C431B0|nr:tumor necrosis factor receptor superfamily member 3-like [Hypanus sabinus]